MRSHEAPTEDAARRHEETIAAADREVLHRRFEAYYAAREERRNAA